MSRTDDACKQRRPQPSHSFLACDFAQVVSLLPSAFTFTFGLVNNLGWMEERITQPCSRLVVNTAAMTRKTSFQPSVPKPQEIAGEHPCAFWSTISFGGTLFFFSSPLGSWFIDQLLFFSGARNKIDLVQHAVSSFVFRSFFFTCAFLFHPMGELIATLAHLLPRGALSAGGLQPDMSK